MWFGHGVGWGGWIFGILMMLLFWGGLIALVVFAVRAFSSGAREKPESDRKSESAIDIVKIRYAKGEISKSEYDEILRDLKA